LVGKVRIRNFAFQKSIVMIFFHLENEAMFAKEIGSQSRFRALGIKREFGKCRSCPRNCKPCGVIHEDLSRKAIVPKPIRSEKAAN